jgi:uncharacterized damage-inducible protein DinB
MILLTLQQLFQRDLKKLRLEIESYSTDEKMWHIEKNIANSAGNLCLHLVGNLNTYIGKELGKTSYVRNRDLEFSQKGLSKNELIKLVDDTILVVENSLSKLDDKILSEEYPTKVFEEKTSVGYMLIHLATHLTYHLGQINYHRRLLDN